MDKDQPGVVAPDVALRLVNLLEMLAVDAQPGDEAVLVDDLLLDVGTVTPAEAVRQAG